MGRALEEVLNKIEDKMVELQHLAENNLHLTQPQDVQNILDFIYLYWKYVPEGDQEYADAVQWAMKHGNKWK
jgi:hypothetical protein